MTVRIPALTAALLVALAGCASAPVNYYTLIPAGTATRSAAAPTFSFDLQAVNLPAQVDQPQLVVRQDGAGIALVESERWIAPLADEVRGAVAANLVAQSGEDLSGLPQNGHALVRIKIDLRRFDSQPGSQALIEAAWSLRRSPGEAPALACSSRLVEPVGAGYDALVQGHQRAIARLTGMIAPAAAALARGETARCP